MRFFVQTCIYPSIGKFFSVESFKIPQSIPNEILDAAYKKCNRIDQKSLIGLTKKVNMTEREIERWSRIRKAHDKPTTLRNFSESLWRFSHDLFSVVLGIYVLWDKPCMWDIKQCRYGYPHQSLSIGIKWYYIYSIAAYWSQIVTHFFNM